jgi:hypothetical protein
MTLLATRVGNVRPVSDDVSESKTARRSFSLSACICSVERSIIASTVELGKGPPRGRELSCVLGGSRLMVSVSPLAGAVIIVTVPPLSTPAPVRVYPVPSICVVSTPEASVRMTVRWLLAVKRNVVGKAVVLPLPLYCFLDVVLVTVMREAPTPCWLRGL